MKNKKIMGFFLIIILIIVSYFIYLNFFKKKEADKINSNSLEEKSFSSNTIKEVSYLSKDTKGNEYIINASTGEIDINNSDVIYLTNVRAEINLKNLFEKTKLVDDVKRDIKGIYNLYLEAIGKYKIDDLKKIAEECNISLKDSKGKNKNKSVLYDSINMFKLNG